MTTTPPPTPTTQIAPRKLTSSEECMVYLAPEVFAPHGVLRSYGEPSDIYSFGWLLYELYMRELTFHAARFRDHVRDVNAFVDLYTLRGARYVGCDVCSVCV